MFKSQHFYSQSFYENDFLDGLCAIGCIKVIKIWALEVSLHLFPKYVILSIDKRSVQQSNSVFAIKKSTCYCYNVLSFAILIIRNPQIISTILSRNDRKWHESLLLGIVLWYTVTRVFSKQLHHLSVCGYRLHRWKSFSKRNFIDKEDLLWKLQLLMMFQTNGHCCEADWNLSFPDAMSIQIYLNMKMEKPSSLQRRNVLSL